MKPVTGDDDAFLGHISQSIKGINLNLKPNMWIGFNDVITQKHTVTLACMFLSFCSLLSLFLSAKEPYLLLFI